MKKRETILIDVHRKLMVMRQNLLREAKDEIDRILTADDTYKGLSDDVDLRVGAAVVSNL